MRLNPDGTADASFREDPTANIFAAYSVALQPDGKILVGNVGGNLLARLNADGSRDPGFTSPIINGANFGRSGEAVQSIVVLADGRIFAAGGFVAGTTAGDGRASLLRLNADGSLDLTFNAGFNDYTLVRSIALQADGKILAGGAFADLSGTLNDSVKRFNPDGSPDPTFDDGAVALDQDKHLADISAVVLQADGKPLIGGNLVTYAGQPRAGVARLGGNGASLPPPDPNLPDLTGAVTGLKTKIKGDKLKVTGILTVTNGGVDKAKNVSAGVYLSDDAAFSAADDRFIGEISLADAGFPKVKAGKPVKLPFKVVAKLSAVGSPSGKYLLIVVDPADKVMESDETNNVALSQLLP